MDIEAEELGIPTDAQHAKEVVLPINAAERKRVLNILAQRRYRRRRRERQAALEHFVSKSADPTTLAQAAPTRQPQCSSAESERSSTGTSPNSEITDTSNVLTWPYTNGSTWMPGDWDTTTDMNSLLTDPSWNADGAIVSLNDFLQSDELENTTFADDFNITVPELDLLRAAYDVAGRLQSAQLLFAGLEAQSIFLTSDCSSWIPSLPKNLQPTTAQLTIPHHPLIDILPWPAVRTRLVMMYSMPSDVWPRHPSDGSASSLVRLVYDMEDGGIRVAGPDPSDERGWELEQRFFEIWWWAFDQSVVRNSDKKRALRGLPKLCCDRFAGS